MVWLLRAFFGVTALLVVFVGVGMVLPQRVAVERTVFIDRPPATVHALIADLRTFAEWAPFLSADGVGQSFSGPASGVGQRLDWTRAELGTGGGRFEIVADESPENVSIRADFGRRGAALNVFDIAPREAGSNVRWIYEADYGLNVAARYSRFFYDGRIGRELEMGLAALRERAEGLPQSDFSGSDFEIVEVDARNIVYVSDRVRGDTAQQEAAFDEAIGQVRAYMAREGLRADGPVHAITMQWNPPLWRFRAAVPYEGETRSGADGDVRFGASYSGRAVRAVHEGDPRLTAPIYARIDAFMAANRLTQNGGPWEVFVTERGEGAARDQVTEIYVPVR